MKLAKEGNGNFYKFDSIDSTNDFLMKNKNALKDGAVCVAAEQLKGRGKGKRTWHNFKGNLFVSFLLKEIDINLLSPMPLVCALAAKDCIDRLSGGTSFVKWPNDVLIGGKKICGILCESSVFKDKADIVCGAGINLMTKTEEFETAGLHSATSVFAQTGRAVATKTALDVYLRAAQDCLNLYFETKFAGFVKEKYEKNCVSLNRRVTVKIKGEEMWADTVGIDSLGRLILNDGSHTFKATQNDSIT